MDETLRLANQILLANSYRRVVVDVRGAGSPVISIPEPPPSGPDWWGDPTALVGRRQIMLNQYVTRDGASTWCAQDGKDVYVAEGDWAIWALAVGVVTERDIVAMRAAELRSGGPYAR